MESAEKELIGYLRIFDIILFAMFILFGIVGIITLVFVGIPGIMFIIPACAAFANWLGKYNEAASCVNRFKKDGTIDCVTDDFRNGERFLNGRVIRGERYLMSRGSGTVFRLDDVVKVYDRTKQNGFAGDTRILLAETRDGKTHELTFLSMKGKDDEDIRRLIC